MTADFLTISPDAPVLGRIGTIETRLVRTEDEVRAAQRLRYAIFHEELGAPTNSVARIQKRDEDEFDRYCEHLLVLDTSLPEPQQVVGTYRLLDKTAAQKAGGFYAESEFDIAPLVSRPDKNILELGRSCIVAPYRSRRTIEVMWQGIWALVVQRKIDVLFGCASFIGSDPTEHKAALAWLGQNAIQTETKIAPAANAPAVHLINKNKTPTNLRAFAALPPLLKGYLRLGAKVAPHAVVDESFGTIDVLVILPVADIEKRYIAHYGSDASRFAA